MNLVPNEQPRISLDSLPYKLAIVGDCPRGDDFATGRPFSGHIGSYLNAILQSHNILRSACFIGNISQSELGHLTKKGYSDEDRNSIETGKRILESELRAFQPSATFLLGDLPLYSAGIRHSSSVYRGSIFKCSDPTSPFQSFKCISSVHPSRFFKEYSLLPLFSADVGRVKEEALSPDFVPPVERYEVDLNAFQIIARLDAIRDSDLVSVDIEGGVQQGITCVGISTDPESAFIINILDFSEPEKIQIVLALGRVLSSKEIPKVLQSSLYDSFCLAWQWKILIRNVRHDTLLMSWEQYPELKKDLGTLCSLHTKHAYYKHERKVPDKRTHYLYCCKDAAVTWKVAHSINKNLTPPQKKHYEFNIQLLPAVLYMELRGIRYDVDKAKARLLEVQEKQKELQFRIDKHHGSPLNINSPKQMCQALYRKLGFPPHYSKDKETGRTSTNLTADADALLDLFKGGSEFIHDILSWRSLDGDRKQLEVSADKDNRVRTTYNLVGTKSGRMSSSESPTGSGYNLQTIKKIHRDLYLADPDHLFFQCDLSGADGWTVAAHCSRLGDSTLFDDYKNGIKPARVIAIMDTSGSQAYQIARQNVEEIKATIARTDISPRLYNTCKMIQHGCYTSDHQLLTRTGWKHIAWVTTSDEVLTYNPKTRTSEFAHPSRTVTFPYTGSLHLFEGTALSLCVTHDHKNLLKTNGFFKEIDASELLKRKAGDLPIASHFLGELSVPEARLVAAFQSDGCLTKKNHITWHFKKERKVRRLLELLADLDVTYTSSTNSDLTVNINITKEEDVLRISKWNKLASAEMLTWDFESLDAFMDEYPYWDGHHGATKSISVMSANQDHLDWLATFCNLTSRGYTHQSPTMSGFGSRIYRMNINNRTFAGRDSLKVAKTIQADEVPVFCVTVPSGYVHVRREGKISISGNSNYGMKERMMSQNILERSWKDEGIPYYFSSKDCKHLQTLYLNGRYRAIPKWWAWVDNEINQKRSLACASGHVRTFFGRPNDSAVLRDAYSQEPQANTTYATSLALHRLWHDPDNRRSDGSLRIEPLHQVHDALCGQFRKEDQAWAFEKLRSYFNNTLTIAEQDLIIPFEGQAGEQWSEKEKGKLII